MSVINPEVLKQDWLSAGIQIWKEMYKYAGKEKEFPEWLEWTIQDSAKGGTGLSDTDLEDQRREMLRASLQRMFSRLWADSRFEYHESLDDPIERMTKTIPPLENQISWLSTKNKIPAGIWHPNKGLCFTTAILDILQQNYGLLDDRIKFTDLEDLCDFAPGWVRPSGSNNLRVQCMLPKDLAGFLNPKLEVEKETETNDNHGQRTSTIWTWVDQGVACATGVMSW
jgi:hypothetical protein